MVGRPDRFYFLLTFWGDQFRSYVCRYMLPSLLAPGNIPALRKPKDAKLLIVTTREDARALYKDPIFHQVRELVPVEIIWDEGPPDSIHRYRRMSNGHAAMADICFHDRAFAVNINPDSVYPDGCIAEGQRLVLDEGVDVVLCAAIRFDQTAILAELEKSGAFVPGKPIVLSMREAVRLGLRNLHLETLASDWQAPNFARLNEAHGRAFFLTCCTWTVPGEEGLLLITHNWSPFFVNYGVLESHNTRALDGKALDGPYIFENFPKHNARLHVVTDSDSLFPLGMTPAHEMVPPQTRAWFTRLGSLGEWTKGQILSRTVYDPGIDAHRRKLYQTVVRWHANDINNRWKPSEALASQVISTYVTRDIEDPRVDAGAARKLWYSLSKRPTG